MYEEMVLSTIYLPNNMRLITNKEKFTIVSKDFLLSMLDKRDMVTFLKTVAHMNLHPIPRNPKYQKWMPMESVNAECLDMV